LKQIWDGFNVKRLLDVVSIGDIFITGTGQTHVIREEHVKKWRKALSFAGHFDIEIDTKYLPR